MLTHVFLLTQSQVDWIIRYRAPIFWIGVLLLAQPFLLSKGWTFGVVAGFMLSSLGVYGLAFRNWRTEPGVWMLAVLLAVTWGSCWAYFEISHLLNLFANVFAIQAGQPINAQMIRFALEVLFGLSLFATSVKLALTVAILNWQRTRATI